MALGLYGRDSTPRCSGGDRTPLETRRTISRVRTVANRAGRPTQVQTVADEWHVCPQCDLTPGDLTIPPDPWQHTALPEEEARRLNVPGGTHA